ncbi:hypothetical protein [Longimicrobium sp.]|uniref:hypothetical protein n=1 Tax=Longimicrobium sp. TaxID=2029185 RepID=UPI003B3BBD19
MNRVTRLASGVLVGGALLSFALPAAPAAAATGGGFCDETASFVCCCTTNADGTIQSCLCKPRES